MGNPIQKHFANICPNNFVINNGLVSSNNGCVNDNLKLISLAIFLVHPTMLPIIAFILRHTHSFDLELHKMGGIHTYFGPDSVAQEIIRRCIGNKRISMLQIPYHQITDFNVYMINAYLCSISKPFIIANCRLEKRVELWGLTTLKGLLMLLLKI